MDTPSDSPEPLPASPIALTPSSLAREWGCSRQYASRMIGKGCPTDSLEKARDWRLKQSKRGVGFRSRPSKPAPVASQVVNSPPDEKISEDSAREGAGGGEPPEAPRWEPDSILAGVQTALTKAREVEDEAHRLVAQAQRMKDDEKIAIRIAAYNKALEGRLKAEEKCVELLEKLQVFITMDFAKQLMRKGWVPLLTRLRSVPQRAGVKANPHDDVHATAVISAEIEDAIKEAQGAFIVEKSLSLAPEGAGELTLT